jgi:hypothetical protein
MPERSRFVDRLVGRTSKQEDTQMAKQPNHKNPAEVPAISRLSDYTAHADEPETWTSDEAELAADYGKLGAHVTSVLEAANEAAAKIRDEARGNAKETAERAQRDAASWLEKARAETDELSREASRLRVEAQEESRELKERANAYATEKRREADRQASALVSQAKRDASEHTRAAQERSAALAKNVGLSEQRLRQLVGGLRELAERLEEILRDPPAASQGEGFEPRRTEESMEESLRRSAAVQGASQPQR